jgi:hypothetical protein
MPVRCNGRKYFSSRRRLPRSCHHPVTPRDSYTDPYRARASLISSTVVCAFLILQSSTMAPLPSIRPHLSRMHRHSHRTQTTPTSPYCRLTPYVITLPPLLRHLPTWLSFPLRLHHSNLAELCLHLSRPRFLWSCRRSHCTHAIPLPHSLLSAPYSLVVVRPDHIVIPTSSASPSRLRHPDLAHRCPPNFAFYGRIVIPTAHMPLQRKQNEMTHQMLMYCRLRTHLSVTWISIYEKVRNFYAK